MGLPKEYVENSIFQRNQTVVTSAPQSAATTAAPEQPAKKEEPKAQEKTSFKGFEGNSCIKTWNEYC